MNKVVCTNLAFYCWCLQTIFYICLHFFLEFCLKQNMRVYSFLILLLNSTLYVFDPKIKNTLMLQSTRGFLVHLLHPNCTKTTLYWNT